MSSYKCLYSKHLTQKTKKYLDGVVILQGSKLSLYDGENTNTEPIDVYYSTNGVSILHQLQMGEEYEVQMERHLVSIQPEQVDGSNTKPASTTTDPAAEQRYKDQKLRQQKISLKRQAPLLSQDSASTAQKRPYMDRGMFQNQSSRATNQENRSICRHQIVETAISTQFNSNSRENVNHSKLQARPDSRFDIFRPPSAYQSAVPVIHNVALPDEDSSAGEPEDVLALLTSNISTNSNKPNIGDKATSNQAYDYTRVHDIERVSQHQDHDYIPAAMYHSSPDTHGNGRTVISSQFFEDDDNDDEDIVVNDKHGQTSINTGSSSTFQARPSSNLSFRPPPR